MTRSQVPHLNCKHPVNYIPYQGSYETQLSSGISSVLFMSAAMLVEWAVPWLVLYLGLSVEAAGEYAGYHYFWFVSKIEVQANFSFVLHTPVLPHSGGQLCSTWGNYHFKTFDGGFMQLKSDCIYTFARQHKGSDVNFDIAIQRRKIRTVPVVTAFLELEGLSVKLSPNSIIVDSKMWVWVSNEVAES